MTAHIESEAERVRRVPGIVFADGPTGRRARLAGRGPDVWEIIRHYLAFDRDWNELRLRFDWLSEEQLRTALTWYSLYPDEIDARIAYDANLTPEKVQEMYPSVQARQG